MPRAARLATIRLALTTGVVTFCGVAWYLAASRPATSGPPEQRWVAWGMCGAALVAALVWRRLREAQVAAGDPGTLIIGWALGEVAALMGAVTLILTRDPAPMVAGLVIFGVASLLFRAPRR